MDSVILTATRRSVTGKQVRALRRQGLLPAVMYGHNMQPINISLNAHTTTLILHGLSSSAIVTIDLEGEQHSALVRERQRNPVKNSLVHIDFQIISMTEKLRTTVSIIHSGEAPAVKDQNAIIMTNMNVVEVEALPGDLPQHLTIDISNLKVIGDALFVRDLVIPAGVEILTDPDEMLVVATGSAPEEAEVEVETALEPEVIERGKKDEEEE